MKDRLLNFKVIKVVTENEIEKEVVQRILSGIKYLYGLTKKSKELDCFREIYPRRDGVKDGKTAKRKTRKKKQRIRGALIKINDI